MAARSAQRQFFTSIGPALGSQGMCARERTPPHTRTRPGMDEQVRDNLMVASGPIVMACVRNGLLCASQQRQCQRPRRPTQSLQWWLWRQRSPRRHNRSSRSVAPHKWCCMASVASQDTRCSFGMGVARAQWHVALCHLPTTHLIVGVSDSPARSTRTHTTHAPSASSAIWAISAGNDMTPGRAERQPSRIARIDGPAIASMCVHVHAQQQSLRHTQFRILIRCGCTPRTPSSPFRHARPYR